MAADQDFNIKVVTTADTTGLKQTREEIERIEKAKQDAGAKALFDRIPPKPPVAPAATAEAEGSFGGVTRTAIGLGTIITLLNSATNKWREFNAEQDRMVDNMIKAEDQFRKLGAAINETQDKAISLRRIGTEPLQQSFDRLKHEIEVLQTEQSLLNLPTQGAEWEKLNADINQHIALLNGVEASMKQEAAQAERTAEANAKAERKKGQDEQSFIKGAVGTADINVQRVLQNEEAARQAQAAGRGNEADRFTRSAEAFKRGLGPSQREELAGLESAISKMDGTLTQILNQFR